MEKVIFIDRDGVINVDLIGDYIKQWSEFRFEKGAVAALKRLCDSGYKVIIISNQAGVGDGVFSESDLDDVQTKMIQALKDEGVTIYATHYCLHGKKEGCRCRKPEIGLLEDASKDIDYDAASTYFIGDKASDIDCGKRFGIKTFFVRTGHGKNDEPKLTGELVPDGIADNLEAAVERLLQ